MPKSPVIAQLQQEILALQGFTPLAASSVDAGLGPLKQAFPGGAFPLGAVHEFVAHSIEASAATSGFLLGLLSSLLRNQGVALWISTSRLLFPPALVMFGIKPESVIFVDLEKERDVVWAVEEALKCEGLAAVVGEIQELDFITSRRLQLAVEKSRVTGFILRRAPHSLSATASVTRWQVTPLPSALDDDLPGVGFPRWNVALLKVRNGRPGCWQIDWVAREFRIAMPAAVPVVPTIERRTA